MMKNIPNEIQAVLEKIWTETNPESMFLYGSSARDDFDEASDFEVGLVFQKEKKVPRSELAKYHDFKNLKLYPFVLEELEVGKIDTPFPKAIYLSSLRDGGKTIFGKEVREIIKEVKIDMIDLVESLGFSLGRAYCAVVSSRQNDMVAVQENFSKAVFYGLQIKIFLKTNKLVHSYEQIVKEIGIREDIELIENAMKVRKDISSIEIPMLYRAISFLNEILEEVRNGETSDV
jgi:predicted nucleotidyltransferase